jgi:hypothetical protein
VAKRRRALRARAVEYLGGRCAACGYDRCLAALDFHHTDPAEKDFAISAKMTSWEAIRRELGKCALLCCRCHREVHDGILAGFLLDPDMHRGDIDFGDDFEEGDPEGSLTSDS